MERDAVHKALISLLRQDVKGSMYTLITFIRVHFHVFSSMLFCFSD